MNDQHIMNEAYNDGFPESESDVHRLGDRPAHLGRDRLVPHADRQATHAIGESFEKGVST